MKEKTNRNGNVRSTETQLKTLEHGVGLYGPCAGK